MGCYGIGIGRNMAAVVEQSHDDRGIIWPMNIAPFKVCIVLIDRKNEAQVSVAEDLYNTFRSQGIDVLLDDRDERAGVKFNDMDLIGIPLRITVGKKITEQKVELKHRKEEQPEEISISEVVEKVKDIINKETK